MIGFVSRSEPTSTERSGVRSKVFLCPLASSLEPSSLSSALCPLPSAEPSVTSRRQRFPDDGGCIEDRAFETRADEVAGGSGVTYAHDAAVASAHAAAHDGFKRHVNW